jgi:outer membrane receptor protein involved in Fe transport
MRNSIRTHLLAGGALVASIALVSPAFAQDASGDVPSGEIVVTGSRIARPDLTVASPVNVVGQEEIQLRQPGTAEDLIRDLPSVRPNLGPAVNNGSDGSASVDLRGIGVNRTLVILDGKRIVPFGLDGVVDLNTVPTALIERVDVVTGGASSVYGADAVAGVVNFVTKRNFSGVQASANYRISGKGDGVQYRGDLLLGANTEDGRGNAVIGLGYSKRTALEVTQRKIAQTPISSANGLFNGSQATVPVLFTSPSTTALGLGAGSFGAILDPATGTLRLATQADLQNTNLQTYFQTPLDRYNIFASAHYEVSDAVDFYGTGSFVRSKALIQLASSASFTNTYQLPLSNAYLPVGVRNQLCAARSLTAGQCTAAAAATTPTSVGYTEVPVIAQRRFMEYGPRGNPVESTQFQALVGVRGDFGFSNLRYDISAQYGETNQDQLRENWGSFSKLQQALRSYRGAGGTPTCTDATNGCVPINLFGPLGSINSSMLGFIDLDALIRRKVSLAVVTGSIGGDLFGLTSPLTDKPVAFSVGTEWRKLKAMSRPDASSQVQGEVLGTGARTPPDKGMIDVREVFGEIIAPLIQEKPFFYGLQAEGGIRVSDYNTTGSSTTWKAGGTYEPFQGYKFRGMYQVAVRSPNINELYQSPVQGLGNLAQDPCQGALPTGNAGLTALCIATGAPASTIGTIPTPSSSQINQTTSGNRNLAVEKATTYTLGVVLTPPQIKRFSLTLDYFHIKVKDAITTPASGDILNGCYSAALNPSFAYNGFCQLIGRNPLNGSLNGAGETPGVILGGSNLGIIETAGIDLGFNYRVNLGKGGLKFGFNGTWLDYYHFQATPNSINRDCTGYYSTNCTNPRPKWKWNGRVTYTQDVFDVSLLWTHISKVKLEPFNATAITPLSTPQPGGPNPTTILEAFRQIKAYDYFDLAGTVHPAENLEISLLVENIFQKKPPLVGSTIGGTAFNNGNTFPTIYDVLGRTFTISGKLKF